MFPQPGSFWCFLPSTLGFLVTPEAPVSRFPLDTAEPGSAAEPASCQVLRCEAGWGRCGCPDSPISRSSHCECRKTRGARPTLRDLRTRLQKWHWCFFLAYLPSPLCLTLLFFVKPLHRKSLCQTACRSGYSLPSPQSAHGHFPLLGGKGESIRPKRCCPLMEGWAKSLITSTVNRVSALCCL